MCVIYQDICFWRNCLHVAYVTEFIAAESGTGQERFANLLLTGSALGGDKFRDSCDMETIPPETDVLINNAHFPSFTSPKFPFGRS